MAEGKVYWENRARVTVDADYQAGRVLYYHREVGQEAKIPFTEMVIEHNEHFLIAYKPHFLPVMPGGAFVNECLQQRLINKTGNQNLQAVHRLDRDTAGLVLFSTNPQTRSKYHQLFAQRNIKKHYQAIAETQAGECLSGKSWHVNNYLARSEPQFIFQNHETPPNNKYAQYAESLIHCEEDNHKRGLFTLSPITGRTHQLRLHMMSIGFPILNDRFYPSLQPRQADNFNQPLQLLANKLSFVDPLSNEPCIFTSRVQLEI
ncbi:pseudouridine synthase [Kangiella aquimarina]|uniref:Pseudouridine synthase n=1 Tax=Kangiella aquimarina TaxID=261965 RepID=A0ABZ0X1B5_9GAMM|nr:pseudouridine synthase [Kangiella aquimarina]WQG84161.1 pseudouridine synthase [Kangiella aquimarina]